MFPAGKKDGEVVEYDGGRTSNDIVAWALDKGSENITPPKIYEVRCKVRIIVNPCCEVKASR